MARGWLRVLSVVLMVWFPANYAIELITTLPSLGMRGSPAVAELLVHGAAAALSFAAGWSLSVGNAAGIPLARTALVATAVTGVQSLYWSSLPSQTKPGDELPISLLIVGHAAAWLLYLARRNPPRSGAS
jgi:hypothetical protein